MELIYLLLLFVALYSMGAKAMQIQVEARERKGITGKKGLKFLNGDDVYDFRKTITRIS